MQQKASIIFVFITVLLDVVGIGIIIPVTPTLVTHFVGGDLSEGARYFGLLVSMFTLMQFLCAPMLGALSDHFGRKPILLLALFVTSLSYLLTAFAPSLAWLFVARLIAGAAGGSLTVATTVIADISAPENRAANFGLLGAAFGLGFIVGPAIGGLLGGWGPSVPFLAAGGVAFLNLVYGLVAVPETHELANRRRFTADKANPIGGLLALRKYPIVMRVAVTLFFMSMAQMGLQTTWVLSNTYRFQWTPGQNGLSLAVAGVCSALVQGGLIRAAMPRLGERRAILGGLAINVVAFTLFGLAGQGWMMYAILAFGSLGGLAMPAAQAIVSKAIPADEQGRMQGALTSLQSLTGIIAPLIAAWLFAACTAPGLATPIPGIAFFLGAALQLIALVYAARVVFARVSAGGLAT
ncbi:MAG: TCR/Tet family MFS transporter [Candidatus Sericytochromatia bacterium]|nr:TCR/Tet family MFS transporter [Candidatus Sericytochromatia bacterium]